MKAVNPLIRLSLSVLLLGVSSLLFAVEDEQGFITLQKDELVWAEVGNEGLKVAILQGNPSAEGLYIMRIIFPAGVFSRPHSHDQDRFVTVIEGTWFTGKQMQWDKANTVAIKAGGYMKHPAGAIHYDGAKDSAVTVEIRGMGPVTTSYVE